MAIEAGVAAKAAAGLCVVGGGCGGIYYGYHYVTQNNKQDQQPGSPTAHTDQAPQELATSKYDDALITFLDDTKRDIVFDIKKDNQPLNTDAWTFSDAATFTVKAEVNATNTTGDAAPFKISGDDKTIPLITIKGLNNGNWTWTCTMKFTRVSGAKATNLDEDVKKKIYDAGDKGLFALLKKDASTYTGSGEGKWTRDEIKKEKIEFVKRCAKARTTVKNKGLNAEGATLEANGLDCQIPEFKLKDGSEAKNGKLVPNDEAVFNEWFKEDYKTKQYNGASA